MGKGWVTNGRGKDVRVALGSGASLCGNANRLAPTLRHYSDIFMPHASAVLRIGYNVSLHCTCLYSKSLYAQSFISCGSCCTPCAECQLLSRLPARGFHESVLINRHLAHYRALALLIPSHSVPHSRQMTFKTSLSNTKKRHDIIKRCINTLYTV